jgi:hypothetical protein
MACSDINPCNPLEPCDPCNEYDNCGCTNPNTFGCTTTNKVRECLGTESGEDGESVLDKIEDKICDIGKVMIDADDVCPEYLEDKIAAGTNITLTQSGTGCDRVITIHAIEGGEPIDEHVKVSADDTTTGYLDDKIETGAYLTKSTLSPAGNEKLEIDVVPAALISADLGNQIILGGDGGLKTSYTAPDGSETILQEGVGVTISGSGTSVDPYIVSTNPSIQVARPCFDNTWRAITLVASGNANVIYASGAPQYRYRFDGTIEFRGSITYTVNFGNYQSSNRSFTIPMGSIPVTCLTAGEQAGTVDMKSINYIDIPQASADQYTQLYGYVIRKNAQNLTLVFQSSFINATSKSVVVNLEGAVSYPTI